jgi:hypothetical protein
VQFRFVSSVCMQTAIFRQCGIPKASSGLRVDIFSSPWFTSCMVACSSTTTVYIIGIPREILWTFKSLGISYIVGLWTLLEFVGVSQDIYMKQYYFLIHALFSYSCIFLYNVNGQYFLLFSIS